jgi:hypothetical protein
MGRSVTIKAGQSNVQLPNGAAYNAGDTVILTDAEWAQISTDPDISTYLQDNGAADTTGDQVNIQAVDVAAPAALTATAPAALTSAHAAGANPTGAEFNALQDDVVALRGTVAAVVTDLTAVRTTLANTLAAIKGTGKPMA